MGLFTILAIVLGIWGVITIVRGRVDGRTDAPGHRGTGAPMHQRADEDAIDYEELRRAEEEVRDLDVDAKPEDGFAGDDWGPGAPKKPPYY